MLDLKELFTKTIEQNASDLHLLASFPPLLRIDGKLVFLSSYPNLTPELLEEMAFSILSDMQKEILLNNKSVDFSYSFEDKARFRINFYYQQQTLAAAFRLLPPKVRSIDQLSLPGICHDFAKLKQGFILVTGPTGQGKSTTIAAIIDEINKTRPAHIITIEDPIEYVYEKGQSIVSQRELGVDTFSWSEALKSALREDPDVVLVGEMRDPESIASAITIAETGHLVFSTLHTNSASQSIDRIIDGFPQHQQNQIRIQLAGTIEGVISQRLIPKIEGGRTVASEVLLGTNAVKSNIREGKTHLLNSIIETSQEQGMISLEQSLADLVKNGSVNLEVAKAYSLRPDQFLRLLK